MHILKIAFLPVFSFLLFAQADVDPTGTWKLTFNDPEGNELLASLTLADGTFQGDLGLDGTIEINGSYVIDGDQITFSDDMDNSENGCDSDGTYKFSIDGNSMTFESLSDACEGRVAILTTAKIEKM